MNMKTSTNSNTRRIQRRGDEILYTTKSQKATDYVTYNEQLHSVLTQTRLRPFRNNGRLKFNVCQHYIDTSMYLYDLAIASYQGQLHADTLLDDMQRYYEYKAENGLSVDHADNNIHNNTELNISLMDSTLNGRKSSIVAQFKPPYYLNSAYCGGEYRVQLAFEVSQEYIQQMLACPGHNTPVTSGGYAALNFVCADAESYVDCLKFLLDTTYEWCKHGETPRTHSRDNKKLTYWAGRITHSLQAQKALAAMDKAEFQVFPHKNGVDKRDDE